MYLTLRDGGWSEEVFSYEDRPSVDEIEQLATEWVSDGDWPTEGCLVHVWWTLEDEDEEEVDSGGLWVEVPPDEPVLMRQAGVDPDCPHDWDDNPGVFSLGGDVWSSHFMCRLCKAHRHEEWYGDGADATAYALGRRRRVWFTAEE